MIVSRTPYRISLFGGGSDYPAWYRRYGGKGCGFAINKYCYISIRELPPFFEHKHRIVYSSIELVNEMSEIQHPSVRAILQQEEPKVGLEIHHDGDLPARSGIGSSSSFTIGLLNAYSAFCGRMIDKRRLAENAIHLEQEVLHEHVGSQDQVWAAYGGINHIDFGPDIGFSVTPLIINSARLSNLIGNLMMFFTGISRYAPQIAQKKIANLEKRSADIRRITKLVDEAETLFLDEARPVSELGEMLHETWCAKRQLADEISSPEIDEIYESAREAGARGGKLLGAGGGGFILFYVDPEYHESVRNALSRLTEVHFDIDRTGSSIVIYEPNGFSETMGMK